MSNDTKGDARRPRTLHVTRSFSRLESPHSSPLSPSRTRASTIQTPVIASVPEARYISGSPEDHGPFRSGDIFETADDEDDHGLGIRSSIIPELKQPETLEQLPIEIRSLTERFLKSLSSKSHVAPLNIDSISELFQDFYVQAETHIETHIAALATRLSREKSPAPSTASKSSLTSKSRARGNSLTKKDSTSSFHGDQQMLTTSEITNKRKARRLLELQRVALEEAVERGICEKVYSRIYRHRSTDDEERDAKLRSKTAALSLVGIGLKELHVDIESKQDQDTDGEQEKDVYELLGPAREALQRMDEAHYPLGKLEHLTAAHKSIVETLSHLFPSSSSADEVLPTLIYTLITSPPEKINVYSALHFIQLFRASAKVDGEAAYCLVNLEAAISFLETVDLSSLRADEAPEGPAKVSSRPETPTFASIAAPGQPPAPQSLAPGLSPVSVVSQDRSIEGSDASKPLPCPPSGLDASDSSRSHQRRLSSLIQAQADRIEAGKDNFLYSADQAIESINSTLENSFKFMFGRLKQQQADGPESPRIIPKTLEDARKLVSSPRREDEEVINSSGRSSIAEQAQSEPEDPLRKAESNLLDLVGGRQMIRDRSADSTKSGGSGKHVAFAERGGPLDKTIAPTYTAGPTEAMGNLMNSLNPLSRFGVPSFPKFGRSLSGPGPSTPTIEKAKQLDDDLEKTKSLVRETQESDLNASETLAELKKTKPPLRKFVDMKDVKDIRLGEVDELLKDYKRLAKVLGEAINS